VGLKELQRIEMQVMWLT